jgi:hypothetical protein
MEQIWKVRFPSFLLQRYDALDLHEVTKSGELPEDNALQAIFNPVLGQHKAALLKLRMNEVAQRKRSQTSIFQGYLYGDEPIISQSGAPGSKLVTISGYFHSFCQPQHYFHILQSMISLTT